MVASVRAIYQDGVLRLLEPVNLNDGQTVNITIETATDFAAIDAKLRAAGLLAEIDDDDDLDDAVELTPTERERIGRLFLTDRSIVEDIDEDRGEY